MEIANGGYRLKVAETNFDTAGAAMGKIAVVKTFAVANAVAQAVANHHWYNDQLQLIGVHRFTPFGLKNIMLCFPECGIHIYMEGHHFTRLKIRNWITDRYFGIAKPQVIHYQLRIGFIIFFDGPIGKCAM